MQLFSKSVADLHSLSLVLSVWLHGGLLLLVLDSPGQQIIFFISSDWTQESMIIARRLNMRTFGP